ncbi:uncharacterized protein LOC109611842 [Musca domestica]|uniref:Uncharacterized protein LOC109611842 n=1 Tax=Musca domestica TaxID=7370 RepID=A0ABM3V6V5_MUSDO|nr:uncharacterized protein LOC109611842 [Musca domestica]
MNVLINLVYCSVVVVVVIFAVTISSVKTQELCRMPNNSPGTCVPFNQCSFVKRLHERYQGNVPQAFYPYIQKLKCSRDNEPVVRLCCEPDTILRPTTATTQPSTGSINNLSLNPMQDYQSQLNAEGFNILNGQRCGTDNGNRIAGGNVTMLAEFPWMALLKYRGPSGDQFRCGGSLITNRYVLTAAHCVNTVDPVIGVRLGEYDTSTEEDCIKLGPRWRCNPPVEDIGIENIVAHPEYSKSKHVNDIALIKLDRNVEFKKHIEPICLPIFSNSVQTQPEDHFLIAGWGFTEKGSTSNVLLKAPVKQLPVSTCSQEYSIELSLTRHLCAGDDVLGRDTCGGDSGGPLIQFVPYNGKRRFVQYGVVASGRYACILKTTLPGVYTNVSNFMPWITHNIVVSAQLDLVVSTHSRQMGFTRYFILVVIFLMVKAQEEYRHCLTPHNESGLCVPYTECYILHEWNKNYDALTVFREYLLRADCTRDQDKTSHWCCEPATVWRPTTAIVKQRMQNTENLYLNPIPDYQGLLNTAGFDILYQEECSTGTGIADDNITRLTEFPWMALLKYDGPAGEEFGCAGSLITNRFVLTAAHCVNTMDPIIGVRLGEHDISTVYDCLQLGAIFKCNPPVEDFRIENIISHPEYSSEDHINDIALIKLDRKVQFKEHIKPICLPIHLYTPTEENFFIAGWGHTKNGNKSDILLKTPVKQLPLSTCSDKYSIQLSDTRHLCFGKDIGGHNVCAADSGGPLMHFGPYKGQKRFIQYGIVAAGSNACSATAALPDIYTNVSFFMPWITHTIALQNE